MISHLDAALCYAERGWKIFPLHPGSKLPLSGSHGVKDATSDPDAIRAAWTAHPDANIGLACGSTSGVYVVDVDVDSGKGVDGFASVAETAPLPETLCQDTPRGGRHYFYRLRPGEMPPANKNGFLTGVDIRGDGYYVVLAPSSLPNGSYTWVNPGAEIAFYPLAYRAIKASPTSNRSTYSGPLPVAPSDVLARAKAYLAKLPPAVQGHGGHDALFRAARCLVSGFGLDRETATRILWNDFNPSCIPPWNYSDQRERADFERKVAECFRVSAMKADGWIRDANPGADLVEHGEKIAAGLVTPKYEPEQEEQEQPSEDRTPAQWQDDMLSPPGLVGDIARWIVETAGCPQPKLALGAALCTVGVLAGRKVRDESNGRTNIYAMGVAPSSSGKDWTADCVSRILDASGARHLIGGEVTSDSAVEQSLAACPCKIFLWDEIGHIFSNFKAVSSSSNGFLKTIIPMFMRLYSSAHKFFVGKQRAIGEPVHIDQPHLCIWGMTSPDVLYDSISPAELEDGWLGRVMTFISNDRPRYRPKPVKDVPRDIVERVSRMARFFPHPDEARTGDIAAAVSPHQVTAAVTPEAADVFDAFSELAYQKMIELDSKGNPSNYLWGKAFQNARRIALIIAAGVDIASPVVTEEIADVAVRITQACVSDFSDAIFGNVAKTPAERDKKKILQIIRSAGREGITKNMLTRRTQWIGRREREEYVSDMVEAGLVKAEEKNTKGRSVLTFFAR